MMMVVTKKTEPMGMGLRIRFSNLFNPFGHVGRKGWASAHCEEAERPR